MENSYKFFCNRDCEYFPCHQNVGEDFNCLFCYCPLYTLGRQCGGNFVYLDNGVKSCENCTLPHTPAGYDYITKKFPQLFAVVKREDERK